MALYRIKQQHWPAPPACKERHCQQKRRYLQTRIGRLRRPAAGHMVSTGSTSALGNGFVGRMGKCLFYRKIMVDLQRIEHFVKNF
jgi:hypothetical protein